MNSSCTAVTFKFWLSIVTNETLTIISIQAQKGSYQIYVLAIINLDKQSTSRGKFSQLAEL